MASGTAAYALWTAAAAQVASAGIQYHQGEKQNALAKKQFEAERDAEAKQEQAAKEEAIAQKQALVAEQESMSASAETIKDNKKRNTYQKQASIYQAGGSGWGLGTSSDKLG